MLALRNGQAIGVRADAADEHRVAVDVEMLRRDRRGDIGGGARDELRGVGGGVLIEDDLKSGTGANGRARAEKRRRGEEVVHRVGMWGDAECSKTKTNQNTL